MQRLPDRPSLSFPCDRVASDHLHHRAVHRDHRDVRREIQRERRGQLMQQDVAAGTEFQSRLGEDAVHRARSDAGADDRIEPAKVPTALQAMQVRTPQVLAVVTQIWPPQDEALAVRKAQPRQVPRPSALPVLPVLLLRGLIWLPVPEPSQRAEERLHADAT